MSDIDSELLAIASLQEESPNVISDLLVFSDDELTVLIEEFTALSNDKLIKLLSEIHDLQSGLFGSGDLEELFRWFGRPTERGALARLLSRLEAIEKSRLSDSEIKQHAINQLLKPRSPEEIALLVRLLISERTSYSLWLDGWKPLNRACQ